MLDIYFFYLSRFSYLKNTEAVDADVYFCPSFSLQRSVICYTCRQTLYFMPHVTSVSEWLLYVCEVHANDYEGSHVLTAASIKMAVLWVVACSM